MKCIEFLSVKKKRNNNKIITNVREVNIKNKKKFGGIRLEFGSVLLLKILGSILSDVNLGELI
jgi:hypothetical protein